MNKNYAEAFRKAEASLSLEGLTPSEDVRYETVKAQVIAGEVSLEDGREKIRAYHAKHARAHALA